jgi:hypothetical protein
MQGGLEEGGEAAGLFFFLEKLPYHLSRRRKFGIWRNFVNYVVNQINMTLRNCKRYY